MSDLQLIGLSGYARAGKDTVANLLREVGFRQIAFADSLRAAVYAFNPDVKVTGGLYAGTHMPLRGVIDNIGWELAKSQAPQVREYLQRMGTEVGRDLFGANFWVDQTFRYIEASGHDKWVISDVRFPNEADSVVSHGGLIWRVNRPGFGPANDHPSETALDNYEFHLQLFNAGEVVDLREDVQYLAKEYFGG